MTFNLIQRKCTEKSHKNNTSHTRSVILLTASVYASTSPDYMKYVNVQI